MSSPQGRGWRSVPVRRIAAWLAAVLGAVTVLCGVAALLLTPVADHAASDGSPAALIVILLAALAVLAAVMCAALLLGLAVSTRVARLRRRPAGTSSGGGDTPAGSRVSGPGGPGPR
jgi:hypothetical protein